MILALDPGPEKTAYVWMAGDFIISSGYVSNQMMLAIIDDYVDSRNKGYESPSLLCVEMISSYGMPVGAEVFETCVWIGRFIEAWDGHYRKIYRKDVKLALCGNMRAKDPNVRQALIDRFGPGKEKAIGTKAHRGPLYGISGDMWSALAIAVVAAGSESTNARRAST